MPVKHIKDLLANNKRRVIQTGYKKYSSCNLILIHQIIFKKFILSYTANNFKQFIIKELIEELDFKSFFN